MSRDRTQEILDIKRRDAHWKWFGPYGLENLQREWLKNRNADACVPDFYVIRTVTLLEVFTRRNLSGLIDHDRPFTDRAIELSRHVKIDFALVRDIQGKTITLGDMLAHSVPVNSFGQIVGYFETILGKPLRPLLETAVDRWKTEVKKNSKGPIIENYDTLARVLTRLFEVRHILCHEAPHKSVYETKELDEFLNEAVRFTKALYEVLTFERFGLVPLTQSEMNIAASKDLKKAEAEMGKVLSDIKAKVTEADASNTAHGVRSEDPSWFALFRDTQEKWFSYRNSHCEFETYVHRGGTIRPTLWASEAERLTRLRIADLESWVRRQREM